MCQSSRLSMFFKSPRLFFPSGTDFAEWALGLIMGKVGFAEFCPKKTCLFMSAAKLTLEALQSPFGFPNLLIHLQSLEWPPGKPMTELAALDKQAATSKPVTNPGRL